MICLVKNNKFISMVFLISLVQIFYYANYIKPFGNPDEGAHFLRAYEVSKGHFINTKSNVGVNISCKEYEVVAKKYNPIAFEQNFDITKINNNDCYVNTINSAGAYSPVPYVGIALGFLISDFFDLNIEEKLFFSRIFNGTICLFIIFIAIIKIPYFNHTIVFLILTPMFLVTIASISADPFLFAIVVSYISVFLNIVKNKESSINFIILLITSFLLGSSKIIYSSIAFISFGIVKIQKSNNYNFYLLCSIIFAICTSLFFNLFASQDLIYLGNNAKPFEQLIFVKTNIMEFLTLTFLSIFDYNVLRNLFFPNYLFGESYFFLLLYSIFFIMLIFSENTNILSPYQRIYILLVFVGIIVLISLSLYMYYNPPGYEKILGLQARYFIPLLFILTITISLSKKLFFINDIIKKWIIVITLFSNFYFIINIHN